MKKEFRIVSIGGDEFKVQRRRLWWWQDEREVMHETRGAEVPLLVTKRFKSQFAAFEWITRGEPRDTQAFVVVQTVIIP